MALRKLQDSRTKAVDLQETAMILQAQLKSSLNYQQQSKPVRKNNGGRGFWGIGGGDGGKKEDDGKKGIDEIDGEANEETDENSEVNHDGSKDEVKNGSTNDGGGGGFWGWRGGGDKRRNEGADNRNDGDGNDEIDNDDDNK